MRRYLQHMFQLILSPGNGWEDIAIAQQNDRRSASQQTAALTRRGFLPLISLTALSVFMHGIYHHALFLQLFMRMTVTFMVYFIGYFTGIFVLSLLLEPTLAAGRRYDPLRASTFVIYTLGLLAMISLIINLLPISPMMLFFLPFYVALIQWKATAYLGVDPGKTGRFMIIAIPGVLLPPYILYSLFSLLIS